MARLRRRKRENASRLRVWIDVENPPQVQYLIPFRNAFEAAGAEVIVTARDYGVALQLLRERDVDFHAVGTSAGASKWRKSWAALRRSGALVDLLRRQGKPDVLLSASRSAVLAARRLRIPSFVLTDYEHADARFHRLAGSYFLHPDVIDPDVFASYGVRRSLLIPFAGIKEDLSFAGIDLEAVSGHRFPEINDERLVKVLFRPPAEVSHYYRPESKGLALAVLDHLRHQGTAIVIFSGRYSWQERYLEHGQWRNSPIVLRRPLPFVELLKGVDVVVSSGGTMLREAAYLGVPAYSIFKSTTGAVDRYLQSIGRLTILDSAADLRRLRLVKAPGIRPLRSNPNLMEELVEEILARVPWPHREGSQTAAPRASHSKEAA